MEINVWSAWSRTRKGELPSRRPGRPAWRAGQDVCPNVWSWHWRPATCRRHIRRIRRAENC